MKRRAILRSLARIAVGVIVSLAGLILMLKLLMTQPVIGSIPASLTVRAEPQTLQAHVAFLCDETFPRNSDHPEVLDQAASYIADTMSRQGARIQNQQFRVGKPFYTNVVGVYGPEDGPIFIIGAHYDVFGELPGADDNASGVAGLLELSRLLGQTTPPIQVQLVAFALEEPPFFASQDMGSAHHARALKHSRQDVVGMISLEMIGYYSHSQDWGSPVLSLLYPNRGDFVMVAGRWQDREVLSRVVYDFSVQAASFLTPSSNTTPVMTSARSFAPFRALHRF